MLYSQFEIELYNWASSNTSVPVIFADENGTRPNENYLSLKVMNYLKIGQKDELKIDNNGNRSVKYDEDVTVNIEGYGIGVQDNIQELKDSLQLDSVIQSLVSVGIAVRADSDITDISTLLDETIEKRYLYEIMMGFSRKLQENVGVIETVEWTPTYN